MYDSAIRKSKRGPSTALRARKNRGKGKNARNFAPFLRQGEQDDDVTGIAADLEAGRVGAV
jgi:hypothetical protein